MISLQDLSCYLEETFSFFQGSDYGPNGLQVEGSHQLSRVAFSVSASLEVIQKAKDYDALIVHHGIFWDKESPLIIGPKQKKLKLLLQNDISLIAYHLPLDAHPEIGNNYKAAIDLGWSHLQSFGGVGVQGEFAQVDIRDFIKCLEAYYGHSAHVALCDKVMVRKAALVSGGAHKMIVEAAKAGVDCFITGSFDEPIWDLAKELGVHFIALGHHATERIGVRALRQKLEAHFSIVCDMIEIDNPF